jgi:hypothetical protein
MLPGMLDHREPRLHGFTPAVFRSRLQRRVRIRDGFFKKCDFGGLSRIALGIDLIPVRFFAAACFGGVGIAGCNVNDDLAKRPDVLGGAIAVLVLREILGHVEQAAVRIFKLSRERFGRRGRRLRRGE